MTLSAQANGDDHASKARRLILRNSIFSVARLSTLKEEELTLSGTKIFIYRTGVDRISTNGKRIKTI
jgi:hypothetical protein